MTVYIIEGTWSGYNSSQRRVVHREYTSSAKRAEHIKAISSITYSDGTCLDLSVREKHDRKPRQPIRGYNELIEDCLFYGVSSVMALREAKEKRRAERKLQNENHAQNAEPVGI